MDVSETDLCELFDAFHELLSAAMEYVEYRHSGDPWEEDARVMNEMDLDDMERNGKLKEYEQLLDKLMKTIARNTKDQGDDYLAPIINKRNT